MLKLFSKIIKHLGLWQKVPKKLKFQHLTMQLYWQPGLIHAVGFITHIWRLLLGALVGWNWKFEKLKIMNLASGSVLAQGV